MSKQSRSARLVADIVSTVEAYLAPGEHPTVSAIAIAMTNHQTEKSTL
jgi:hypothetical protein